MTNVTLKKYIEKLTQEVENKISDEFPSKFFYGNRQLDSLGFLHVIRDYGTVLLALSPVVRETSFAASDFVEFINYVLNLEIVVAITGDNTGVNKSIANM